MARKNEENISVGGDIEGKMKRESFKLLKRKRSNKDSRVNRIIKILFIILLVFIVAKGVITCTVLKIQEKESKENYNALVAEKSRLEKTVEYINTPEYIEQAARETLKMVMPGEILFIFSEDENKDINDDGSK